MVELVTYEHRRHVRVISKVKEYVRLEMGAVEIEGLVKDQSFEGMCVQVSEGEKLWGEGVLYWRNQPYKARVCHRMQAEGGVCLGISLGERKYSEVEFTNDESGWDLVREEGLIRDLFGDVVFKLTGLMFRNISGRGLLRPSKMEDGYINFDVERVDYGFVLSNLRTMFRFEIFSTCHAYEGVMEVIDSSQVRVKVPAVLARLLRRETVRVRKIPDDVCVRIGGGGFKLHDVSENGLSVRDVQVDLVYPCGYVVDGMEVEFANGSKITCEGVVCSSYEVCGQRVVGFELRKIDDETRWHNFVLGVRYPGLDFYYKDDDHQKIWELFERSGFLKLKGEESHDLEIETKSTWMKLAKLEEGYSKRPIIRMDDKIVGHIQMDQLYPKTWCIHHLAIDPKVSILNARDIYSVTTDVLLSQAGQHIINFTEADKPWNQRSYYDFIESYRFKDHNQLKTFDVYEVNVSLLKIDSIIKSKMANKYDLKRISRYCELYFSTLERNALYLNEPNIVKNEIDMYYKDVGLFRKRIFIVPEGKRFDGFALLDMGDTGLNVVGVQDMVYVYLIDKQNISSLVSLLLTCRDVFKLHYKTKFLVCLENNFRDNLENIPGLRFVTKACRWIAKKDILPRYHSFAQTLYGRLILRKEMLDRKRHLFENKSHLTHKYAIH